IETVGAPDDGRPFLSSKPVLFPTEPSHHFPRHTMNAVLKHILRGEALDAVKLADLLALPQAEVDRQIADLKRDGILLGWRPVLNPDYEGDSAVRAHIEVKIRPEGGLGFDRVAERIAQFEQVETCYLMSGAFDLVVIVKDSNLRKVASFVHDRLAKL